MNYARELNPDFAFFDIRSPYPKTKLYQKAIEKGVLEYDFWRVFASSPNREMRVRYWEDFLGRKEPESLLRKEVRRFYFCIGYILKILFRTRSLSSLLLKFKKAVSMGYYLFKKIKEQIANSFKSVNL